MLIAERVGNYKIPQIALARLFIRIAESTWNAKKRAATHKAAAQSPTRRRSGRTVSMCGHTRQSPDL